jgi:hypothetical protein
MIFWIKVINSSGCDINGNANPNIAPLKCARCPILSDCWRDIYAEYAMIQSPKINAGMPNGINSKPILVSGLNKIDAKITADTAPDAPTARKY